MDINEQAEQVLNLTQFKESIKVLSEYLPELAKFSKQVYEEYKKAGFSNTEAFDFTKNYILTMSFKNK